MPRANLDPLEFESRQESLAPLVRRARLNLVLGSLLLVAVNLPWLVTCAPRAPSAPASLEVTSFQAIDAGDGSRPFLRLRFSAPAVADKEVGRPLPSAPAALLPAVAVRAHWSDRQTLVLVPERPLETGASYDVVLTGELAARTRKIRFEFVNRQLRLLSLSGEKPHSLEYLAPRPHLILMFDQDVRATEAARACYLTERASLWPIRLVAKEPSAVGKILGLTTAEALAPERQFLLRCAGLTAEKGGAPLTITHRRVMRTHGPFAVTVFAPWKAGHPPDEARVEVRFSTPVSQEEARRRIRIEPPVNGFSEGYVAWGGTRYLTTLNLQPNTSYKVVVDAALTDELGQRLGKDAIHLFTTGRHLAQLKTSSGIFALETSARGYPIWTRHLTELTVSCAMVSEESVAKVLSSNVEYEPSPRDGLVPEIRWAELGLQARKERLSISGEGAGSWKLHELDLPKLCASPSSASIEGRGRPSGGHKGLYLAELRSEELRPHPDHPWRFQPAQRVLVNRTDLGVLAKIGPSSGLVWVTSLVTGKPVAGAKVSVRSALGAELHRGVTDFQGRLPLPGSEALRGKTGSAGPEAGSEDGRNRVFVFVKTPADFAVVDGTWSKGVHLWSFGVNVDRSPQASRLRGFIQSDRGVYRPGEQVNFKGLLRRVRPGALPDLPTSRAVHVSVRDPKGQLVMEREVAVSAFGGFAFELPLSNEARTGDYYVTATVENQAFRERFQVEAFRKVTFEIEARPETGRQTPGEPLRVALGAKYLFGAPVSGGRVSWTVRRRAHVLGFPGFADFRFDDRAGPGHDPWEQRDAGGHTEHVTDGQAILDAQGRGSLLIASGRAETTAQGAAGGDKGPPGAPAGAHSRKPSTQGPEDYVASITVTDAADQSVSRSVVTTRHFTDRYLGISTGDYVRKKGRPFEIKATALALEGRRVAQSAVLELIRVRWGCKWQGAFRSDRTCTPEEELGWRRPVSFPK
ncbi:MAG: MG2 domain-containing protein, partial [Polyangia bacterium]|nr:MG2 domain-containing protein [Polyangia bacterium]